MIHAGPVSLFGGTTRFDQAWEVEEIASGSRPVFPERVPHPELPGIGRTRGGHGAGGPDPDSWIDQGVRRSRRFGSTLSG